MGDAATLEDVDQALRAAWASYQTRALNGDDSAGRVMAFLDDLLDRRLALQPVEAS